MEPSTPGDSTTMPSDDGAPSDAGPSPDIRPRDPDTQVDRLLVPVLLFIVAAAVYAWINNGRTVNLDYFVPLADAFLHGRLGLEDAPSLAQ